MLCNGRSIVVSAIRERRVIPVTTLEWIMLFFGGTTMNNCCCEMVRKYEGLNDTVSWGWSLVRLNEVI